MPEAHGGVRGSSIHTSGKASKPLERSGPHLAHVYRFTRELTQGKQINPSSLRWHLQEGKLRNHWTDRDHIVHTYADSSGNRNRLDKIYLSSPQGYLEVVRGHTLKHVGKMPNIWTDRDQILHTYAYYSGNGQELTNNPLISEERGFRGSSIKQYWKVAKQLERL